MSFRKLCWRDISPRVAKVLCDIASGKIVGYAELKGHWWKTDITYPAHPWSETIGVFGTMEEAKNAVTQAAQRSDETVVMEEAEVLVVIYEKALRNIVCCGGRASEIARNVMADPAKWLEGLRAISTGEE